MGGDLWGRVALHLGGEAGKGCTLRKKAWLLPHVAKDSHIYMSVFGGRKLKSFSRWGRIRGERYSLAMHLEVKRNVNLIPCGEGFTWKDSCAFKVEESLTPSTYRERFVGERALHLKGLAMIFAPQENLLIIFRSKEIYIYFKTNNKIPINLLKLWGKNKSFWQVSFLRAL